MAFGIKHENRLAVLGLVGGPIQQGQLGPGEGRGACPSLRACLISDRWTNAAYSGRVLMVYRINPAGPSAVCNFDVAWMQYKIHATCPRPSQLAQTGSGVMCQNPTPPMPLWSLPLDVSSAFQIRPFMGLILVRSGRVLAPIWLAKGRPYPTREKPFPLAYIGWSDWADSPEIRPRPHSHANLLPWPLPQPFSPPNPIPPRPSLLRGPQWLVKRLVGSPSESVNEFRISAPDRPRPPSLSCRPLHRSHMRAGKLY